MSDQFEEFETLDLGKKKDKKTKKPQKKQLELAKKREEEIQAANEKKYKQLLKRISETLIKNNPDLAENPKILLKPPQVEKEGTKKTAIKNFVEICKQLDRHPEHVMNYFLEDLGGTSGSIGNKGLSNYSLIFSYQKLAHPKKCLESVQKIHF